MTPKRRISTALAAIALLAGTSACDASSNAQPMPSASSVVPTLPPSQTPAATASASTTQLAAAQAVYRSAFAEQIKLVKAGGIKSGQPAPAALSSLVTGDALTWMMSTLNQINQQGAKYISGDSTITAVQEASSVEQHSGSTITLHSCEDSRSLITQAKDGKLPGTLSYVVSAYKPINGRMMMVYYNDDTDVATCPVK